MSVESLRFPNDLTFQSKENHVRQSVKKLGIPQPQNDKSQKKKKNFFVPQKPFDFLSLISIVYV
jgi:hypothetical protein